MLSLIWRSPLLPHVVLQEQQWLPRQKSRALQRFKYKNVELYIRKHLMSLPLAC
jgi:hypothetical protein